MGEVEKSLGQLAEEINAEHRAFVGTFEKTLEHGIRAGGLLAAAKEQCPHGTWLPWLKENFQGAPRTAQEYLRLHNHRDEVRAKARDSAHLSMSGALKEIAAPRETADDASLEHYQKDVTERESERPERAGMSAEKALIVDALAEVNDISFADARQHYKADVSAIRDAVEDEMEGRDARGDPFDAGERADYARRVAAAKKASRAAAERYRQERRKRHTEMFFEMDAHLSRARREVKEALDLVREEIEFDEEEVELLERRNEAVQAMSRLVGSALSGDSGTDWDAELARLEERRQWGAKGEDDEAEE